MTTISAPPQSDYLIVLQNKTWQDFEAIEHLFQGVKARRSYFDGEIRILMPSQDHEFFSRIIGALLNTFCFEHRILFFPTGSFTQKRLGIAAAEADESFCFNTRKPIPDLSIEITFTSGNESKLKIYQSLGVPEVWFWEDGVLRLHRLRSEGYELINRSEIPELRELDIALLSRCILIGETDLLAANDLLRAG